MEADPSLISINVLLGILLVDILLSGDNAIVIALVCRSLPKSAQWKVMWLGIAGALVARVLLTGVATLAMQLPMIKLVGGLLLLKISVSLIVDNLRPDPSASEAQTDAQAQSSIYAAAQTIIVADIVMSLDNVLALSAVTNNNFQMLVLGLVLSIPILMFGSIYISKLLDMFPILLWAGAAVLGGVSGGLLIDDPIFGDLFSGDSTMSHFVVPLLSAAAVVQIARIMLDNQAVVDKLPPPRSLWNIVTGSGSGSGSVPSGPTSLAAQASSDERLVVDVVRAAEPSESDVFSGTANSPDDIAEIAAAGDAVQQPAPAAVVGKAQARDYRVVALIAGFVLVVGGIIYAMVGVESAAVPDRFIAYRCKTPSVVVRYRANPAQVRLVAAKGVVDATVDAGRIIWTDAGAAAQVLGVQPPLRVSSVQDDALVLDGGAFDHTSCVLTH